MSHRAALALTAGLFAALVGCVPEYDPAAPVVLSADSPEILDLLIRVDADWEAVGVPVARVTVLPLGDDSGIPVYRVSKLDVDALCGSALAGACVYRVDGAVVGIPVMLERPELAQTMLAHEVGHLIGGELSNGRGHLRSRADGCEPRDSAVESRSIMCPSGNGTGIATVRDAEFLCSFGFAGCPGRAFTNDD